MITKQDLQEAIAECQGVRNPNASTALKLAAFYTIQDHLYGDAGKDDAPPEKVFRYSFAGAPAESTGTTIDYDSGTEFSRAINGRNAERVWAVIDEMVEIVKHIQPALYKSVLRKIEEQSRV